MCECSRLLVILQTGWRSWPDATRNMIIKTLYGNAGGARASKMSTPLHYSNLAASDTQKRPNLRQTLLKTSQIPPYGNIAAIGLVASAEQVYAKQVDVGDVVTSTTINPDNSSDVLLDLSSLDVSGFTPNSTDLYASIIELTGSTATIWNSPSTSLVSGITLGSSFVNITGISGADSLTGNGETNTINGGAAMTFCKAMVSETRLMAKLAMTRSPAELTQIPL